jgi:ABC-type multidrug transport system ATPase subunit
MLRVEAVSKAFRGGTYGVRELSLEVLPGVLGLLGPNGAGKTTLMQMIATVTKPTAGRIVFDGVDVAEHPDAVRRRLGYLPQDFGVYDDLTAFELLDYVARLKGVRSRARVAEMLEMVNLHAVGNRPLRGFSGGMRQRLGIAQALVSDPDLVIVDEPTAGLDPEERVRFRNLLSEMSGRRLVLLSTHIVSDVESIAGEIAVMREGRLVTSGPPEALLRAAEGSAWEAVVSSADLERRRAGLTISSLVRRPDGVHLRLVAPERPLPEAVGVEPDLEEAYLYLMRSAQPERAAPAVA